MNLSIKAIKRLGVFVVFSLLATGSAFAQSTDENMASAGGIAGLLVVMLVLFIVAEAVVTLCLWKVFIKAGHPGWASLVPVYNLYILCKIVGKPGWWVILLCIPAIQFVFWVIISLDLAKSFGKEAVFAVGLMLLPFIFLPVLGFGDAVYKGPAGA